MKFYVLRLIVWLPNAVRQTNQPKHIIVIYDVSVKSEILFCKWARLGNERSELTNPTNKIKSLLTRPSYIYFLYNWFALH
jgi:hypothetical protein